VKTLETKRLILRKFRPDDLDAFYSFLCRPENSIYSYYWPNSVDETRRFISESIKKAEGAPCEDFQYAAVLKAGNILIGSCNFVLSGDSNMGWIVNCEYWNQGYGTEMARAMLDLGFLELGLPRIIACCDAENAASFRIMEKIGMRREGLYPECRRAHKCSDRKLSDEVVYTISRDEWAAQLFTEIYHRSNSPPI